MATPEYKTLQECIDQIEKCGFEDPMGHPIENNIGYIQLVERAKFIDINFPKEIKDLIASLKKNIKWEVDNKTMEVLGEEHFMEKIQLSLELCFLKGVDYKHKSK